MSLAGLRKQINKANQFMNERIGGATGTKLDEEYVQREKKVDIMSKLIEDIVNRTQEYLQPNPATRAKLATVNTFNKMQGKSKVAPYPQPEGQLGDCMLKYGTELGQESLFGECLVGAGKSFKEMADAKYSMEDQIKSAYIEPLRGIQTVELKDINANRKKLEGRRLDYDCKKRQRENNANKNAASDGKQTIDEVAIAEQKFQESKILTESSMINFLNSDLEHISALTEFVESQAEYFRQAADIMNNLQRFLLDKKVEASKQPKTEYTPAPVSNSGSLSPNFSMSKNGLNSPVSPARTGPPTGPCCRALYQFDAENSSELQFYEGDIIQLISRVDENWFEGSINNREGVFPVNYVEVIVPLQP